MTLRNKLTISSTLLFAFTLGVVMFVTFLLFQKHTKDIYYKKLLDHTTTAAYFYFERDELNDLKFREIEAGYRRIHNEAIRVYRANDRSLYVSDGSNAPLPNQILTNIVTHEHLTFAIGETQYAGLFYKDNQGDFIIVVSGIDADGNKQLSALSGMLLLSCLIGVSIHYLLALFLSEQTFRPFSSLLRKVNTITTENIHSRLEIPEGPRDEIKELVVTFNELLQRLENGILIQKNFLKNASHELKTPLTVIIGDIDVALNHPRTNAEYEQLLKLIKSDAFHFKSVLESLLVLSGLEISDPQHSKPVRIDEILWDVLEKKAIEYPGAKVRVDIGAIAHNENLLVVKANRELLFIALSNLLDNAIKFSDQQQVDVAAGMRNGNLCISIADSGPGIPLNEQNQVFDAFYRSSATRHIKGQGLGLTITKQILDLHHIDFDLKSAEAAGTTISLAFPAHN